MRDGMRDEETVKERNKKIDMIKGLAIITVVLGHAICIYDSVSFNRNPIFKFCYSFHMPLFVFINGILSGKSVRGGYQIKIVEGGWLSV